MKETQDSEKTSHDSNKLASIYKSLYLADLEEKQKADMDTNLEQKPEADIDPNLEIERNAAPLPQIKRRHVNSIWPVEVWTSIIEWVYVNEYRNYAYSEPLHPAYKAWLLDLARSSGTLYLAVRTLLYREVNFRFDALGDHDRFCDFAYAPYRFFPIDGEVAKNVRAINIELRNFDVSLGLPIGKHKVAVKRVSRGEIDKCYFRVRDNMNLLDNKSTRRVKGEDLEWAFLLACMEKLVLLQNLNIRIWDARNSKSRDMPRLMTCLEQAATSMRFLSSLEIVGDTSIDKDVMLRLLRRMQALRRLELCFSIFTSRVEDNNSSHKSAPESQERSPSLRFFEFYQSPRGRTPCGAFPFEIQVISDMCHEMQSHAFYVQPHHLVMGRTLGDGFLHMHNLTNLTVYHGGRYADEPPVFSVGQLRLDRIPNLKTLTMRDWRQMGASSEQDIAKYLLSGSLQTLIIFNMGESNELLPGDVENLRRACQSLQRSKTLRLRSLIYNLCAATTSINHQAGDRKDLDSKKDHEKRCLCSRQRHMMEFKSTKKTDELSEYFKGFRDEMSSSGLTVDWRLYYTYLNDPSF